VVAGLWSKLFRQGLPEDFTGKLDADEAVLAYAAVRGGGYLVATTLGLWLPEPRRVGWHLISKATWGGNALIVIEALESGLAGSAVVLADQRPQRFGLDAPGKVPQVVHAKVTGSIRSRHRHGDAWFLQRKVPGRDGVVLQVRPDEGADMNLVRAVAADVAAKIEELRGADNT
jgi:hypothetical protein